jgi:hypothetical protein
MVEFF